MIDIRDGEGKAGVPLLLDIQFVDIDTCEPIPKLMADSWFPLSNYQLSNGEIFTDTVS